MRSLRSVLSAGYQLLPEPLRVEIDVRRRQPHWRARGVILVHVPKAAGTSVGQALYGRSLGHFRALDIRRIAPRLWESCFTVAILREPVSRLQSAYRFAVGGRTDAMAIARPHLYAGPDFSDFERFATRWLPRQNLETCDPVFRPQYRYVCDAQGAVMVDALLRLECLEADLARYPLVLGAVPRVAVLNASDGPVPPVSEAARESVLRLYARDVALHAALVAGEAAAS